ncbi:hypothetical protein QTG54_007454, partial [Skeletonema marinoi]
MDDHDDDDDDTVVGNCLHCNAPPPPRSSEDSDPDSAAATRVQVSCDDCRSFICDGCHWCHEFQANHEIRVCDRCDAFYCRGCDEMDQCEDCSEVVCNTCSTLMSCKFCGCGLCEDCATACGRCGIVLCARDAKFAVECDTCKMSYCLVCLASGTKDPCVRCGHRPSKRVEQLVHLRLKSIYKAFKQSGASVGPSESSPGSSGGGSHSGTVACNHSSSAGNNKTGRDASTIAGKYSSTLRSLAENDSAGTPNSDSKDNIGAFDQSMANEVAAVLQTASNAMASNADGDTADSRRSRGKRVSSHSSSHDGGRNRARANSASERYYRKTQAELEAAAAAAEADAEAAAAALLAELDKEDASAVSKKKKKKKKKEKKKDSASEPEQLKPNSIAEKEYASSPSQKKRSDKKASAAKNTSRESDEDSSDDEINFEQLVGRTKGSTKASKKKDRKEADVEEKVTATPIISKPKVLEPVPPVETSTDFDKELAILLSNDDEQGLEIFLDKLRGVPGLGAARKTAKKALKRIKEAKEPALFEEDEPPFENITGITVVESERKSSKNANKGASQGQSSRVKHTTSTTGTDPTNASSSAQQEPLLRVVSRTPSNTASSSTRGCTSNSASAPASARGECVMHMSPLVVGWVIGKGGQRIRDMMEESGAKIWIDQESMAADEARVVYVSGKRSSVDSAVRMVKDLVAKAPFAASTTQTPTPNKLDAASDEIAAATSTVLKTDSAEEPPSFAAATASAPSTPAPATKSATTQDVPVSKRGWAASQTQNAAVSPTKSPTVSIPSQSNISTQAPAAASIVPQISDNVRKEFACHAHYVSQLVAAGIINVIQAESGASVLVDQSGVSSKIVIHGQTVNVNKAEQFLRNAINSEKARQNTFEVASNRQSFGAVDANAVVNLTQGFQGASLSSYQEPTQTGGISSQSIPPGYIQPSQPGSLGSFADSQLLPQPPLLNTKSLPSQTLGSGLQHNKPPESWASQNRSILPQFPPHAGVSNAPNSHQPSAFGLPVDLNQTSYNALAQSSLQSHHVLPERVQGAPISGLPNSNFGDSWSSRGDHNFTATQRFDAPLFTDTHQSAPGAGTLGGIPFGQTSNDDSQMVDNMFASL